MQITENLPFFKIREDIDIFQGAKSKDGSPTWVLFDPLRDMYFRVGLAEIEVLGAWDLEDNLKICEAVQDKTGLLINSDYVESVKKFLVNSQLIAADSQGTAKRLTDVTTKAKKGMIAWLVHNYLFIRIPLIQPDKFLTAALPYFRFIFTRKFFSVVMVLFFISVYLISREFGQFITTFFDFFDFEGFLLYALAIGFVKILHEMGHGFCAKYYGLPVNSMGLAFIVLFPILYTDTTHSWRLTKRVPKLKIAAAGMIVEFMVAIIATIIWAVSPEGGVKTVTFFLAAVSWISTLLVNTNPLMRFDGYYFLSDFVEVDNLQNRSIELGKWFLRELLFGFKLPSPEDGNLPQKTQNWMLVYAYSIWIYRFFLFLGIALVVYYMFFKLLGIILFTVEILWFLALPIFKEILMWWKMREHMKINFRTTVTFMSFIGILFLFFFPWSSTVEVPAVYKPSKFSNLFISEPARLDEVVVKQGDKVKKGDILFKFKSPTLERKLKVKQLKLKALESRLKTSHIGALQRETDVIKSQILSTQKEIDGLNEKLEKLSIYSPISGIASSVNEDLYKGLWVNKKTQLAYIADFSDMKVIGYINEKDFGRINKNSEGEFYFENNLHTKLNVSVEKIDKTNSSSLSERYLASIFDGNIPVRVSESAFAENNLLEKKKITLTPDQAIYKLEFLAKKDDTENKENSSLEPNMLLRGAVQLEGERKSFASRIANQVTALLIRESGF